MTKPLSIDQKIKNIQTRVNAVCNTATLVSIHYVPEFNVVALTGDGLLVFKAVISNDRKNLMIVNCPEKYRRQNIDLHNNQNDDRFPEYPDTIYAPSISWQKFEAMCKSYKKAWKPKFSVI